MGLVVYNTLTNKKEKFVTIEPNKVKMYVCGPTVYNLLHIGNFRGPIFYNLLKNWLTKSGFKVTFVFNYTDVDDKIINSAKELGVTTLEHSEKYIKEFEIDFSRLGLDKHDFNPKVTEYINEIKDIILKLIDNKHAYEIDGEVFYDIKTFKNYGLLSGKKLEDLEAGIRVEVDQRKKHPSDFVLWKPAKEGEPSWESPWGAGRPGWHIECTAMIHSILGDKIDIHGGGIDLIFPHHENEIAQAEGSFSKHYCSYWIHNEFINLDNQKMSKSLGNVITGRDFLDKYHPEILKYIFLTTHYRSVLNINNDKIHSSFGGLERIYKSLSDAEYVINHSNVKKSAKIIVKLKEIIEIADKKITKSFNDDMNTPEVFAQIFSVIRVFNELSIIKKLKDPSALASAHYFKSWIREYGKLFSLFILPPDQFLMELDDITLKIKNIKRSDIDELITKRIKARLDKDFTQSDLYRDQLLELGITIFDGAGGTRWSVDKSKF